MKLTIHIDGREAVLDFTREGGACRFQLDSEPERAADVTEPEPGLYSVLIDGRSYEARVETGANGAAVVTIDGHRFEIEVRDPRKFRRGNGIRGIEGRAVIAAPMPGKVVRLVAQAGQEVAAGQPVVVIEAMKMQNELRAPKSGRVVSLPVREGDTVAAGEALAAIE